MKHFHHLSKVLLERAREGEVAKTQPGKQELEHYLQNFQPLSEQNDAVDFWVEKEKTYPLLSSMAVDIPSLPLQWNEFSLLLGSLQVERETD